MDVATAQTIFYLVFSVVLAVIGILMIGILIAFIRTMRRVEQWMDQLEARVRDVYKRKLEMQIKALEFLGYLLGIGGRKGGD